MTTEAETLMRPGELYTTRELGELMGRSRAAALAVCNRLVVRRVIERSQGHPVEGGLGNYYWLAGTL